MTAAVQRRHLWTRQEYDRMVEAGVLGPESRVELLDGEIIEMPPQGPPHVTATHLVADVVRRLLPPGLVLRMQAPLALDDRSEPEPDICIVRGSVRDFADHHPTGALLIIEVSDSSLDYDRGAKAMAYARGGIPEYWIIDLKQHRVQVMTEADPRGYRQTRSLSSADRVASAAVPEIRLAVSDLLP
jgi:Uma2 family endonuclease